MVALACDVNALALAKNLELAHALAWAQL